MWKQFGCYFKLFLMVSVLVSLGFVLPEWVSDRGIHTILETLSLCFAMFAGALSLAHYKVNGKALFLFLGVGFLGTSFLDAFHATVTTSHVITEIPGVISTVAPWSWFSSRFYLSILMLFTALFPDRLGAFSKMSLSFFAIAFSLVSCAVFSLMPVPTAHFGHILGRPQEFLPGILFSISLVLFLVKMDWRNDSFYFWLVSSTLFGVVAQTVYMPFSTQVFDKNFDLAHIVKIVSYLAIITGFLSSMLSIFKKSYSLAADLSKLNDELEDTIELRTKELTRSNKELENFAYVASHDLQEPLRVITGYLQLFEKKYAENLDGKAKQYVDFIIDASARMKTLINDLLDFSRVTTKGLPFKVFNARELAENTVSDMEVLIDESNATVYLDIPNDLEIRADKSQIYRVLNNLVANSIKYKHLERDPIVHVVYDGSDLEFHKFSVKDNGMGIEEQYFERIFIIFQRLHTREEYSGTGLGLAICKKIIERHKGEITVSSTPGEGSTFVFSIPRSL